jgi:hypothetical protein
MHRSFLFKALVFALPLIVSCKGGGGSGGSSSSGAVGEFSLDSETNIGNSCVGYTMSQSKCEGISGTWNSSAVPEVGECSVNSSQNNGVCKIGNKKFTALAGYSQDAIDVCESFGGVVTPVTLGNCNTALGTWTVVSPATTAYSCSSVPTGATDCNIVGGVYGNVTKISGRAHPVIADLPAGVNTLNTGLSVPTGYGFSVGTRIVEINATLSLWKIFYGPAIEYWKRSFDISKSRDFYANKYDATLDFTASYGEAHLENDYQNGAYVKMNVIYVEDI